MTTIHNRLEIYVDVFDERNQRALPLAELTPAEFIQAILEEFKHSKMEFLGDNADDYRLIRADNGSDLKPGIPLGEQLTTGDRVILEEKLSPLPEGTTRPFRPLYLRELSSNHVFRIQWAPALIGRPDPTQPHDDRLAVNLRHAETGLRVSRRHAQILEEQGRFFIQSLSSNPTSVLRDRNASPIQVTSKPLALLPGDIIILDRSNIMLKVILRRDTDPTVEDDDIEEDDIAEPSEVEPNPSEQPID